MQVYKCFMKIVRQNLNLIIMYLAIFVVITVSFSGIATGQESQTFADAKVNLTVIDRDGSAASGALQDFLYERHKPVPLADDTEALQDALYSQEVSYVLFIPSGYEETLLTGGQPRLESTQSSGSYSDTYVDRQAERFISTTQAYLGSGLDISSAMEQAQADLSREAAVTMTQPEAQAAPPVFYYYKFLSYCLMLILIFGLCPVLMVFGRRPLAMRMNASALPMARKNLILGLGAATLAVVFFAILILVGFVMYGSEMLQPGLSLCIANALCFLAFSLALAFLIGQFATSGGMLSAIANAVVLAMCFLGGVFVPYEFMGAGMQSVAQFIPTYWYVHVADLSINSTLAADTLGQIWQGMGIQILFAVALLAAALVVSRRKRVVA